MSASLVGSEMCIRDSNDPVHTDVHALRVHANVEAGLRHDVQLEMTCGHPVSYTHLTLPTICSV
eukprot:13675024-Alexandrium_andersonii.AAC.1